MLPILWRVSCQAGISTTWTYQPIGPLNPDSGNRGLNPSEFFGLLGVPPTLVEGVCFKGRIQVVPLGTPLN